jgi:hypothetical protein
MTYDRRMPERNACDFFCAKKTSSGYVAIAFPPTFVLGSMNAPSYSRFQNKDAAVDNSDWISPERKAFLKERFRYWERWWKENPTNVFGSQFE